MNNSIYAEDLKCEDLSSPLAIDIKRPRFSWICTANNPSTARNKKQTAYRIIIAASEKDLLQNKGTIWDSGKISADTNIAIKYGGKTLISFKKYYWKVMLWDEKKKPGKWSAIAQVS